MLENLTGPLYMTRGREVASNSAFIIYAKRLSISGFPAVTEPQARLFCIFVVTCSSMI